LLTVVGIEWEPFNHEAILEEKDTNIVMLLEAFDVSVESLNLLFLSDEIKLFNSSGEHFSVDFLRQIVAVLRSLKLQLLFDGLLVERTFVLTTLSTNPFEPIVF
jgi:hypothetical protein